jgi:ferrous iron transport protein A
MSAMLKLSELAIGTVAVVRGLPKTGGAVTLRLREMGVLPGTKITLMRAAPLGDPLEIKVRGYNLSLRKSEAEHVIVEVSG